ncbi:MAG: GGDEF domain-containing protein [Pseudanabaena frigida]|uniref:GGDEF domain-containing protein n=1 Tax=Pseudanabaena frigida TaxID=945775 RepID=A0A2W4W0V0_9CYAN|nr:MAG: GGDEF domain-containing protein [Pseudanabaena frigida]
METENHRIVNTQQLFLATVESLENEINELKTQNFILKAQLDEKVAQQEHLLQANKCMQAEIVDLKLTETALRLSLDRLLSEKNDLEIILDTTTSHSDTIEAMMYDKALLLAREVTIDGLTQIANRRAFDQRLEKEWQRLARESLPMSMLLCDVDFFKRYNDRYGHPTGDECLRTVAKAIDACIRRPADLAARYGGEEFAVILPNTEREGATFIAEQICQVIDDLAIPHEASYVSNHVTISIGISSTMPDYRVSPKNLIESADKGLYLAKNQGRNRAVFSGS